jgi:plasmid replication initiation protein
MGISKQLNPLNSKHHAVISNEVFDNNRYKLSTHAQRLLFTLIQNLDTESTLDLFPEWEIDMGVVFKYMGLEQSNNRYEIVQKAFFEMATNPLQELSFRTNSGVARWKVIPWFSAEFDPDKSESIKITFQDGIKPYLLKLKANFCQIKISYLKKLSTQYSTWLYPLVKSHYDRKKQFSQVVVFEISIQRLKEFVYVENEKSYNPKKTSAANRNFISTVIGVCRNSTTTKWDYIRIRYKTKDNPAKEKYSGALYDISQNTDITVTAIALKTGRSYDRIQFTVIGKEKKVSKALKTKTTGAETEREKKIIKYTSSFYSAIEVLENESGRKVSIGELMSYYEKTFNVRVAFSVTPLKEKTIEIKIGNETSYISSIVQNGSNNTLYNLKKGSTPNQ